MKSILQSGEFCYLCGSTRNLEEHHIFFGNPLRKISEKNGFKIKLCPYCHRLSKKSPHQDRETDLKLKKVCQREYEKNHMREEFEKLIGRNYL